MPDIDYQPYLAQVAYWPREDVRHGEGVIEMPIHEMNPGHAINAYHALIRWAVSKYFDEFTARRCPLARALLNQAIGVPVVYEQDLPEAPHVDDFDVAFPITPYELSLEGSYDIVMAIRDIVHPVRQAQELIRLLRRVPTT